MMNLNDKDMSIKTTHTVRKDVAKQLIIAAIERLTCDELEDVLEYAVHNKFYNFTVVEFQEQVEEARGFMNMGFTIESEHHLPEKTSW